FKKVDCLTPLRTSHCPRKHNVSIMERKALKELQSNPKIIIKQSDKGGTIIVMNTTDYVKEAMRQLSNTTFYQVLSSNPTERFVSGRYCILNDALANNWITEKQFDFLKNDFPTIPVLYLLPKIHKSLINPPWRPIISSNESLLEPLSQFVDCHIRDC
uniref:Uncharacterized protein n=1 Tax=Myripristis murdjan TaxID=586833 RepID=A0A667W8W9_9TELE